MRRTRRIALNLLKLSVSLSLIACLVSRMDMGETWGLIGAFDVRYLGLVLLLSLSGILVNVYKWSLVLSASGLRPPLRRLLRLFWIGAFFNNFLPGRTGGDLIRAYGIARDAENRIAAALSVAVDRGINLAAVVAIGLVALAAGPEALPDAVRLPFLLWGLGLCAAALLILAVGGGISPHLREATRVGRLLGEASRAGAALLRRPALLLALFALGGLYQTTMILSSYAVARGLGLDLAPGIFFCLIPITALITMLPISLNGLGLREGAYALTFARVGIDAEAAVAISIAVTLCMAAVSLVGGLMYAAAPIRTRPDAPAPPAAGGLRTLLFAGSKEGPVCRQEGFDVL